MTRDPVPVVPRRSLGSEWPILCVLAVTLAGFLVVILLDRFRRGTVIMAASVILAAWLRALLPTERAGVLAVRRKAFDVAVLLALGAGLLVLALVVPPPPGR